MPEAPKSENAEELRVLRFLRTATARLQPSSEPGRLILSSDKGSLACQARVIARLSERGSILRDGEAVTLAGDVDDQRLNTRDAPAINLAESPLALLATRKDRHGKAFLTAPEIRAGERLRADFTRGHYLQRLGINWQATGASSGTPARGCGDLADSALDARARVEAALETVGPELSGVLIDVCCFLKGLEQVERERSWPVRSAKIVLKTALGTLARHYDPEQAQRRRSTIVNWGTSDYRPSLHPKG